MRHGTRRFALATAAALVVGAAILRSSATCSGAGVIHGVVVDNETREPIHLAAVTVVWSKKLIFAMDGGYSANNVAEALTDAAGQFSVANCPGANWNPFARMDGFPTVTVFKPRYEPYPFGPNQKRLQTYEIELGKLLEGKEISLQRTKSQKEDVKYSDIGGIGVVPWVTVSSTPILRSLIDDLRSQYGWRPIQED